MKQKEKIVVMNYQPKWAEEFKALSVAVAEVLNIKYKIRLNKDVLDKKKGVFIILNVETCSYLCSKNHFFISLQV